MGINILISGKDLFQLSNVHYETNSDYGFEELNEALFISRVFEELQVIMREKFYDFEFYIFSNHKKKVFPESIHLKSDKKKILFYFSDESGKDPTPYASQYFAIFKAYIGDNVGAKNIFPVQIGYVGEVPEPPNVKPVLDRKYNVFFRGNLNKNRIDFLRNLSRFKFLLPAQSIFNGEFYRNLLLKFNSDFSQNFSASIIIFNSAFKSGFTTEKYGKIIADSKIVLCPKGYDMTECFRHFEAMRAGCVIISEKLPKTEFYSGSPIFEVENWKEGLEIAKRLLGDPILLKQTQIKVMDWWKYKCSEKATAKYVNDKIMSLINVEN